MTDVDFDELVATHKADWLATAASVCRVVDPPADNETVHVLDAATLPEEARRHALAWTAGGLDRVLRDRLRDRRRGPVLVLNVAGIVRSRLEPATSDEHELAVLGRLEVSQVGLHELGHARVAEATGRTLPADASIPLLLAAVATPTSDADERDKHGPAWVRSYLVLSGRAARSIWPRQWWTDMAAWDVRRYRDVPAGELVAALQPEIDSDEPLVNVLRRPPPAAFLALFVPQA